MTLFHIILVLFPLPFYSFPRPIAFRLYKMSIEASYSPSMPVSYSLAAFDRLPNRGIYCLKYAPERPIRTAPVSSIWKQRPGYCPPKRKTLDFLRETQMYIERIRKPQVVEFMEKIITPRKTQTREITGKKSKITLLQPLGPTYSLKYIGNLDGKITVVTTRLPLQCRSKPALLLSSRSECRVQTQDLSELRTSLEATRLPSRGEESLSIRKKSEEFQRKRYIKRTSKPAY